MWRKKIIHIIIDIIFFQMYTICNYNFTFRINPFFDPLYNRICNFFRPSILRNIIAIIIRCHKFTQCLEFLGDHSEAGFVSCRGQQYILFYAETIYNGIPTTQSLFPISGYIPSSQNYPDKKPNLHNKF